MERWEEKVTKGWINKEWERERRKGEKKDTNGKRK